LEHPGGQIRPQPSINYAAALSFVLIEIKGAQASCARSKEADG
jgi:hypothetical protein